MNSSRLFKAMLLIVVLFLITAPENYFAQEKTLAQDTAEAVETYQKGDRGKAVRMFAEILEKRPNDTEALYNAGRLFVLENVESSARSYFERLIALQPANGEIWASLAYFRWLANEKQAAAEAAQKALRNNVETAGVHHALAENFLINGDYNLAMTEADKALKLDANYHLARITKHFALTKLDCTTRAIKNLEEYLKFQSQEEFWISELKYLRNDLKIASVQPCVLDEKGNLSNSPNDASESSKSSNSVGSGRGNGIGTGNGIGVDSSTISPQISDLKSQKLVITTKPKASYTERARKGGVAGTIRLRLTFTADKTIKNVRVLSYLPFGLTEQAIIAAYSIKFEPEMRDGSLKSTTRLVEYSFSLY